MSAQNGNNLPTRGRDEIGNIYDSSQEKQENLGTTIHVDTDALLSKAVTSAVGGLTSALIVSKLIGDKK